MFSFIVMAAVCIVPPVNGPVISKFAPVGQYQGHWGVDFAATPGSAVRAPVSGTVTFAGSVAGMNSVTIEPVPNFKVSLSYLGVILAQRGQRVEKGSMVASSGMAHGKAALHLSTRIDGRYVDPEDQMGCRDTDISRALRLVAPPQPYPRTRANRNSRRDLRPDPRRPSPRRRDGDGSRAARPGPLHPRG